MRVPAPAISPDRIGIIGSTQGVNASPRPPRKNHSRVSQRPEPVSAAARRVSSASSALVPASAAGAFPAGGFSVATGNPSPPNPPLEGEGSGSGRSEEHTSELQSLMRISYAVFCLKKKKKPPNPTIEHTLNHSTQQKKDD